MTDKITEVANQARQLYEEFCDDLAELMDDEIACLVTSGRTDVTAVDLLGHAVYRLVTARWEEQFSNELDEDLKTLNT